MHTELTRIVRERDALVALGSERDAEEPEGGRRTWAGRAKRDLARLRRRHRAGEITTRQALRQVAGAGHAGTVTDPVEWTTRFRALRDGLTESAYSGDRPLQRSKTPAAYARGLLWKDLLEPAYGHDPDFLKVARFLAIRTGDISEELRLTSRLAVSDLGVRKTLPAVNGRARELSGWIPRIPGPVTPMEPASDRVVLHLLRESRPYVSHRFASRSHHNVVAERDSGLEPVVLTELGFPRDPVGGDFPLVEEVDGVPHHRLDNGISYAKVPADRRLEDFAWSAYRTVMEVRPAVVQVSSGRHGFETALVALALKAKTGVPVVYEVRSFSEADWTSETESQEDSETYRRRLEVERMCMEKADAVLALGEAMREELISRGIAREKINIVPDGVDPVAFRPRGRDLELAAEHRITGPSFGCVCTGDGPPHGEEALIKATSLLKERGVHAQCVIVGGGKGLDVLRELARLYGVADRVVITGTVGHAQMARYYELIDVVVVPRGRERAPTAVTPTTVLEAMAMERPVVVADLPALAEIVEAPSRGRVFEAEDAVDLARVLQGLLADEDERRRLGAAGREWVERERTWDANGPRYLEVHRDVLKRMRQRRDGEPDKANEGA